MSTDTLSPMMHGSRSDERTAAANTLARLTLATLDTDPACKGDRRFTLDRPTDRQQKAMGKLCDSCPVRVLCEAHAAAERPVAGFWAGVSYPLRKHDLDKEDNDQ